VEHGPQDALAETVVRLSELTNVAPNWDAVERFEAALDGGSLGD